jgi:ABC-type nickel/cobalt efflux system permease component RcnA
MLSSYLHKNQRRLAHHLLGYWIVFVLLYACFQPCPTMAQAATQELGNESGLAHGHPEDHHPQTMHSPHESSVPHACTHAELPDITLSSAQSDTTQPASEFIFKTTVLILTPYHSVRQPSATAFVFSASDPPPRPRSIPANTRLLL